MSLTSCKCNIQSQRLSQKSFSGFHGTLQGLGIVTSRPSGSNKLHFHLSNIAADTGSRTVAERDKGSLLSLRSVLPALRFELLGIGTPDLGRVMHCVRWD